VIYIGYFPYCLFVSNSQAIGCEDRLRNDLCCVGWGVKLYSIQSNHRFLQILCQVSGLIWVRLHSQWYVYKYLFQYGLFIRVKLVRV